MSVIINYTNWAWCLGYHGLMKRQFGRMPPLPYNQLCSLVSCDLDSINADFELPRCFIATEHMQVFSKEVLITLNFIMML